MKVVLLLAFLALPVLAATHGDAPKRHSEIGQSDFRHIIISDTGHNLYLRDPDGHIGPDFIWNPQKKVWQLWIVSFAGTVPYTIEDVDRLFGRNPKYRDEVRKDWELLNKTGPGPFRPTR